MLTDRFIKNAKPGKYADEAGLYLKVYATGKRVFVFRSRTNGVDSIKTLGAYPELTLANARTLARGYSGGNGERTLEEAYKPYYRHLCREYRTPEQADRMFQVEVLPVLGGSSLLALKRADYMQLVQKIVDRGSRVMANRVFAQIKKFLEYAEQQGWIDVNPLAGVKRSTVGGKEKSRSRNLTTNEIEHFLRYLQSTDNHMTHGTRWALYGILLTGCRSSEVLNMSKELEILDTKSGRAHNIPKTIHVRAWMRVRPTDVPKDHRVLSRALARLGCDFTPHDLRRTFASRVADLGVMPHVVEKMLNHTMQGVMAVYNRAEYWPERYEAQSLWDCKLRELRKNTPD